MAAEAVEPLFQNSRTRQLHIRFVRQQSIHPVLEFYTYALVCAQCLVHIYIYIHTYRNKCVYIYMCVHTSYRVFALCVGPSMSAKEPLTQKPFTGGLCGLIFTSGIIGGLLSLCVPIVLDNEGMRIFGLNTNPIRVQSTKMWGR